VVAIECLNYVDCSVLDGFQIHPNPTGLFDIAALMLDYNKIRIKFTNLNSSIQKLFLKTGRRYTILLHPLRLHMHIDWAKNSSVSLLRSRPLYTRA